MPFYSYMIVCLDAEKRRQTEIISKKVRFFFFFFGWWFGFRGEISTFVLQMSGETSPVSEMCLRRKEERRLRDLPTPGSGKLENRGLGVDWIYWNRSEKLESRGRKWGQNRDFHYYARCSCLIRRRKSRGFCNKTCMA
jgi:hypothetical protein